MIEYKVLAGHSTGELKDVVEAAIHDFWMPQGGVAIAMMQGDWYFAQAMVRTPNIPEMIQIKPGMLRVGSHSPSINKTSTHELVRKTMAPAVPGVVLSDDEKRELEVMMAEVRRREQQNVANDARTYAGGIPQIYRGPSDEESSK